MKIALTKGLAVVLVVLLANVASVAQHSVARQWNEVLLDAIRNDFARPTIHARNLFHTSVALYDSWAVYDDIAQTYFLGRTTGDFQSEFSGIELPTDIPSARKETMSYASYRLLSHRFQNSPGMEETIATFDQLMTDLGYDVSMTSVDYASGSAAALGNYMASQLIDFGLQDGANESNGYVNQFYLPVNNVLIPSISGATDLVDPNRWQPLGFDIFIDQSGNAFANEIPDFLSPEWGSVVPFSLKNADLTLYNRDNAEYKVYHDAGAPPYIDIVNGEAQSDDYKWGFSLVSVWSSQLDPADGVMWDISPASCGNITSYPDDVSEYPSFYQLLEGGDPGTGYDVNPITGLIYTPQVVPRGDYARVLAEFWADGPDSETPPGHWFTLLNYISDHPLIDKSIGGSGPTVDDLEWDVKSYFLMGGAMHDAAVASWGIKGWYDYIRPISALRSMCARGQSTDPSLASYQIGGVPLLQGYIELVEAGDALSGTNDENVGKIKVMAWRGPDYIDNAEVDMAGVGWILADDWWPYQRPTFVTPPFAGYISGHSTYSRAAAEILTMLTGDEYFPGGLGEFQAIKNEFLVFEEGPSVDISLQWAKYKDASDQCSLSRIWGGIHPPADDIPGRKIGEIIGREAFLLGLDFFNGLVSSVDHAKESKAHLISYPNPVSGGQMPIIIVPGQSSKLEIIVWNYLGEEISRYKLTSVHQNQRVELSKSPLPEGLYIIQVLGDEWQASTQIMVH